jgi:hypothetical protein
MKLTLFKFTDPVRSRRCQRRQDVSREQTLAASATILLLLMLFGCHQDMYDQVKKEPLEGSTFFEDGRSARPLVAGTIARGQLETETPMFTGKENGQFVSELPMPVTQTLLERGQSRFNIYCTPCHGSVGDGDGMIVSRGFKRPPSFHIGRLRGEPVGHFFDVMSHGFGAMPSYGKRISPEDRWAITAYVRALQLSQFAPADSLTTAEAQSLETSARNP